MTQLFSARCSTTFRALGLTLWVLVAAVTANATQPQHVRADDAAAAKNDEEARVHFRLGTAYYDSGRFAQAAEEYKQAYEMSHRPELLYNLFLAYRDAGDIRNAATALRQYLTDVSEVADRDKLEARLAALEKILASQPAEPAPATDDDSAEAQPEAPPPAPEPAPTNDSPKLTWLPWAVIGGGGALVVTGLSVGALGIRDESKLEKDCPSSNKCSLTDKEVDDLKSSGKLKTQLGDALWITGAVVAGVGVAFIFWKPWEKPGQTSVADVSVVCGPSLCGGSYARSF